MLKLIRNQNHLSCVVTALVYIVTADANHLRDSINCGLQAVLDAKNI